MCTIIDYSKYIEQRKRTGYNRFKALAEGLIESYTCNNCGEDFEVYDNELPEKCPSCGVYFVWDDENKKEDI